MNALDCSSDLQPQPRKKKVRKNQKKKKKQRTKWTENYLDTYRVLACWRSASSTLRESLKDFRMEAMYISPHGLSVYLPKLSQETITKRNTQPPPSIDRPTSNKKTLIHRPKTLAFSLSPRSGFGPSAVILSVLESEAESENKDRGGVRASIFATCTEKGVT